MSFLKCTKISWEKSWDAQSCCLFSMVDRECRYVQSTRQIHTTYTCSTWCTDEVHVQRSCWPTMLISTMYFLLRGQTPNEYSVSICSNFVSKLNRICGHTIYFFFCESLFSNLIPFWYEGILVQRNTTTSIFPFGICTRRSFIYLFIFLLSVCTLNRISIKRCMRMVFYWTSLCKRFGKILPQDAFTLLYHRIH